MKAWNEAGLILREYSPGDGVTRYRFFARHCNDRDEPGHSWECSHDVHQSYFGPANGIYTALGIKDAETFLAGCHHA